MHAILYLIMLVGLVCSIIIIIDAFRDEVWKGIVSIIFPLYLLYYAFTEFDHEYSGLIKLGVVIGVISRIAMHFI